VRASVPALHAAPAPLRIRVARHPVLFAERPDAVPFDVDLLDDGRVLLISGPNTGGKTVLLKAVGLLAALAQAGVVPPVGPGTELPHFARIFADIGDHQSIEQSLSTFSAHLAVLNDIVRHADGASLVLLDELGSGTDPVEGAALASAILLRLVAQRSVAVATTHLSQLKQLAAGTKGLVNASLEFDAKTLSPSYRLLVGVPGRSYALVIARRLGLPEEVLKVAESMRSDAERSLDALLADVEARSAELANREARATALEAALEARAAELGSRLDAANEREHALTKQQKELQQEARKQARAYLLDARKKVEDALALARAAVDEATAKQARRLVEEGIREEADALKDLEEKLAAKGWTVKGHAKTVRPVPMPQKKISHETLVAAPSEVDLRGMDADEAEAAVLVALDAAVLGELPALRIIHGKGTGVLRTRIQQVLKKDPRVAAQRLAPANQGGTGVTIADLKA
jgi:DNA mismatch repair protein MutS2